MTNALVPVEQKTVTFYDDQITAVLTEGDTIYIPIRPICELLGVDWSAQRQRLNRDSILSAEIQRVVVTTTRRGDTEMLCLPLDFISGFLFGINANRVKPELRDKIIRYQYECYKVLAEAFTDGRLTASTSLDDLVAAGGDAAEAYKIAEAILRLARHQLFMESRIDNHELRLEEIEAKLSDDAHVSDEQAAQLSQAVKAVAIVLGQQTKRNEFGGVYGELYRRYNCSSYKLLQKKDFEGALNWLNEWKASLESDTF